MSSGKCLLLVDDDPISLQLMQGLLSSSGYDCQLASSAEEAQELLAHQAGDYFSAILLDNMMPRMSGLELLKIIKSGPHSQTPVIMQTGDEDPEQILQCLNAGAFYYMKKPLNKNLLVSVVESAISDLENHRHVYNELNHLEASLDLLEEACFKIQRPDQATKLAAFLARLSRQPEKVSLGLYELLINAIEHGNLAISYDEKSQLIEEGRLSDEITQRLTLPEFCQRQVTVQVTKTAVQLEICIQDEGSGFEPEDYLDFSLERALDNHGRGIMMANKISFDQLNYSQGGSCVTAIHILK